MLLKAGFVRFRGFVMNGFEAGEFRRLQRKLNRCAKARRAVEAQDVLRAIKDFAGDHEVYRQVFEALRQECTNQWQRIHGTCWKADLAAQQNTLA